MAAIYAIRPGFDHMVKLRCYLYREWSKKRGQPGRFRYYLDVDEHEDSDLRHADYASFVNHQKGVIAEWLEGDHVTGRYTIKFFLNDVLVSFEDKDTAFAFKMRFG